MCRFGHAKLTRDLIEGYEKHGPAVSEVGSTLQTDEVTVRGEGPSPYIAQNGIQVAYGAKGKIQSATVTGNEANSWASAARPPWRNRRPACCSAAQPRGRG